MGCGFYTKPLKENLMLDLKFVRTNLNSIKEMIKNREYDLDLSQFERLDEERRDRLTVLEELRHRRNQCQRRDRGHEKERVTMRLRSSRR